LCYIILVSTTIVHRVYTRLCVESVHYHFIYESRSVHSDTAWAILLKTLPLIEMKKRKGCLFIGHILFSSSKVHVSFLVQDPFRKETNLNMELFCKNYILQVLTLWRTMMCFRKVVILVLYNAGCINVFKFFCFNFHASNLTKKKVF
jgi:hypothetical protein